MSVLVDYVCRACSGRVEAWVSSPPPATRPCPACGAPARRAWAAVGVVSRRAASPQAARRRMTPATDPLCARNPDVPGLCHMSPSAGRAWVARARGDNRGLDRELEPQKKTPAATPPTLADVAAPDHGHAHQHTPSL